MAQKLIVYNVPRESLIEKLKTLMPELKKDETDSLLKMGINRLTQQEGRYFHLHY